MSQSPVSTDILNGVDEIAEFLGCKPRRVRYARETGALPIRVKPGLGLYAFKSELITSLHDPDGLPLVKQ